MDKSILESSEFYNKRFNNFSVMLIVPTAILFVLIVIFSLFGQREITVKSIVQIDSGKSIPIVQSLSSNQITNNYLKEGAFVHKNDVLVTYQSASVNRQLDELNKQKNLLNDQIKDLDILKESIGQNKNLFTSQNKFGYDDLYKSYANQRQVYLLENSLLSQKSNLDSDKKNKIANNLNNNLQSYNDQLNSYDSIFNAIKNGTIPSSSKYSYIYQSYTTKDAILTTSAEKNASKEEYLNNLQQNIDQLKNSIQSTTQQKLDLESFDSSKIDSATNDQKLSSLQNDQLKNCSENKINLIQKRDDINLKIDSINSDKKELDVRSPSSGVTHVINSEQQGKIAGTGTVLAQIYPILNSKQKIKLKAYISSSDISSVRKNQMLRMKVIRNVPTPIIIEGRINNISVAPVIMDKANYYVVEALAKIKSEQINKLHYGMSGQGSVIIGQESFFTYYKNCLFNQNSD